MNKKNHKVNFDFNIGQLNRSPCLGCIKYKMPGCMKGCETIKEIQRLLAGTVTLSRDYTGEEFKIYLGR